MIEPAVLLEPGRPPAPERGGPATRIRSYAVEHSGLRITFAEDIDPVAAEDPKNFLVMINGATYILPPGFLSYDAATRTTRSRALPIRRADRVAVTVTGLWERAKNVPEESVTLTLQEPRRR